jgi:transposase-like protein
MPIDTQAKTTTTKTKMATEAEKDVKAELFNLLSTDKDLISKVTEALSSTIVNLVIKSNDFLVAIVDK